MDINISLETEPFLMQALDSKMVADIVKETIREVYPHYYPEGAVQYFLDYHSPERIEEAMSTEEIYLLIQESVVLGTGSIRGQELCRLFILPKYQRMGYGTILMNLLEEKVFAQEKAVIVDASFPAEGLYLKRGYQFLSYEKIETDSGDFLCYHKMRKRNSEFCNLLR